MYESVSGSDNADVGSLAGQVSDLLGGGRAGLVTDVDGTISPIVARPEDAFVLPSARRALSDLRELLSVVAVVSGRSVTDARRMVEVDGLVYVGNHGLEILTEHGPQLVPEARSWVPRLAAVLDEITRRLESEGGLQGVIIENKVATASLHYRLAPDHEHARRELLQILARCAVASGFRVEEGRMVINVLPPVMTSKGSAVTRLVRENALGRLVYLGDDLTDAHAFQALCDLKQSDGVQTLGIAVVGPETPPSVRQLADAGVPSVTAVADLLSDVVDRLRSGARMELRAPGVGST